MYLGLIVKENQYYDSVFLMGVNKRLSEAEGVRQSAVVMASETNKRMLAELGFSDPRLEAAGPNDLVVAVLADAREVAEGVLGQFDQYLNASTAGQPRSVLRTLRDGLDARPDANLAVISVPGEFAAREARQAVERGLHVFLFSDNVSLEDEIAIKMLARERGVLVMGPDCGTSIIGGIGIGFANMVRRGPIGVVGPAGTGLQEFTCLVHHLGGGVLHAIGTGSRDLSDAVGGETTLAGLRALENDPQTEVIAVISKTPGRKTLGRLLEFITQVRKPVVTCFLGVTEKLPGSGQSFRQAKTIDEAASLATGKRMEVLAPANSEEWIARVKRNLGSGQRFLRGILAGGTFCYQSQQILREGGLSVYSNTPIDPQFKLEHPDHSREHSLVDMGEDFYTRGRPHPMIDGGQRAKRIIKEAEDPTVAVILLDFILGYNCSSDPVGELLPAIETACRIAEMRGGQITFVASLTGTELDPQDYGAQRRALEQAGVFTFPSNATAAEWCLRLLKD